MAVEKNPDEELEEKEEDGSESEEEENEDKEKNEDNEEEEEEEEDGGEKKEKKEDKTPKEDEEVKVRKTPKDWIIERKNKKIEKLSKKNTEEDDEDESDDDDDLEDILQPEAKKAIKKESRRLAEPLLNQLKEAQDERELRDFIAENPEAKSFEKLIRKYMDHPAYQNVPVSFIYFGLAAKSGKKVLTKEELEKKRKEADEEAEKSKLGGSTRKPAEKGKLPDFSKMSDTEFAKWEKEHQKG